MKEIIIIALLIGINAFFAAAEISIISLNKINLQRKAENGDKKAKTLLNILKEPSKFLATIQVGVTLASFFTSASAAVVLVQVFERFLSRSGVRILQLHSNKISFFIITIITSYLSLLFGELIPKRVGLKKSEYIASRSVGIINIVGRIARPLVLSLTYSTNFFVKLFLGKLEDEDKDITEEEIKMLINVGEEKGLFGKTEKDMINSIFQFDDIMAFDVMTPRPDMITLGVGYTFHEVLEVITNNKRSRIPVYNENIDDIVGILYAKDLINYVCDKYEKEGNSIDTIIKDEIEKTYISKEQGSNNNNNNNNNNSDNNKNKFFLNELIREPFFITGYIKIDELFKEMQKKGIHICIVIDEYGSTAGLVTMEDLIEEIFGNIFDEYEEVTEDISIKNEFEFEVDGGITVGELNELLDSDFKDIYDTVSGLILDSLGRFPIQAETILLEGYKFTIIDIEDKRIKKILINKNTNSNED